LKHRIAFVIVNSAWLIAVKGVHDNAIRAALQQAISCLIETPAIARIDSLERNWRQGRCDRITTLFSRLRCTENPPQVLDFK
jgi:hypothetical protein